MSPALTAFLKTWRGSAGNERANFQSFLRDFCVALELPVPEPKGPGATHCFEKDLKLTHLDGSITTGAIDLYREGCFVLEAKQGSTSDAPGSAPRRGTRAYDRYMEAAFGQAVNYARNLPTGRPPFVITCDIGHAFHVWDGFSGSYGGYGARRSFTLEDLAKLEVQAFFRALWLDPQSQDPARRRTAVTRDVAKALGELAASLEGRFPSEAVARFLMRVVFTFFAEDVGLLPQRLFENALKGPWKDHPEAFPKGLETLWDAMNTGGMWGPLKVLRFNGGLFQESLALALNAQEIAQLGVASSFDWSQVDPSIFGTLLESALDPAERHRLGAHYTPRAYVERLLRPALEEPLRGEWELAQAEAMALLGRGSDSASPASGSGLRGSPRQAEEPTEAEKAKARDVLHGFQRHLAHITVLDPACGSGNFLAASYDILKRLEGEVQRRLVDLGETGRALALEGVLVTPAQFQGLEVKPWAAAIADLVLWISHLQWFHRLHPELATPEPVLQAYGNIQCRDAVLTWKGTRETGRSRWDGRSFKTHPVTGKQVPDENAQVAILEYLEPKPAAWPEADFIVGNPPFLGNKRMRDALGDGYSEALRKTYPEVPDSVDFVLYWWHKAAEAVRSGRTRRFGFITTNSLTQTFNRRVIAHHTGGKNPLKLLWAIPDHPWTDEGAAVRIAMTVGGLEGQPWLGRVVAEGSAETPEAEAQAVKVEGRNVEDIHEDLRAGADVASAIPLKSNSGLSGQGVKVVGEGFYDHCGLSTSIRSPETGVPIVRTILNAQDILQGRPGRKIIDFFGLTEVQAKQLHPAAYQQAHDEVLPIRQQNNRASIRNLWWRFAWERPVVRDAIKGLGRYLVTLSVSKHRFFVPISEEAIWDGALFAIASNDAFHMGVLSSRVHLAWALAAGGRMGVGNDPTWTNSRCFDPFPFPEATAAQKQVIRDLAERLDAHRKGAQARGVTITGMYNLLEKLRAMGASSLSCSSSPSGLKKDGSQDEKDEQDEKQDFGKKPMIPAFTPKERELHALAQTEILRQLHDELDAAVAEAYGWPVDLSEPEILERLVALNRERAAEEARGLVRWLRPEYQAPQAAQPEAARILDLEPETAPVAAAPVESQPWPKELKAQLAALRGLLLASDRLWDLESIATAFKSRGRYRDSIAAHLDLLADLGMVHRLDTPAGPRWCRPQALGA